MVQALLGRAGYLAEQRIGISETAGEFRFESGDSKRTDGVGTAGAKPWIFAEDESGYGFVWGGDLVTHEAAGNAGLLGNGDTAVEQREKHVAQLRLENVIEEFERVVDDGDALGLESLVGGVEFEGGIEKGEKTENALALLLDGIRHRGGGTFVPVEGVQNLVGTVVSKDFRRENGFKHSDFDDHVWVHMP